jgi:hypothetical protein
LPLNRAVVNATGQSAGGSYIAVGGPTTMQETSLEVAEQALEETRNRLGWLLAELSRRRHHLVDLRTELRRNAAPVMVVAASVLLLTAGGVALAVRRSRRERTLSQRAQRLGTALSRMMAHPDRVARPEPTLGRRVARAALTSLTAVLVKQLAQAGVERSRARLARQS